MGLETLRGTDSLVEDGPTRLARCTFFVNFAGQLLTLTLQLFSIKQRLSFPEQFSR